MARKKKTGPFSNADKMPPSRKRVEEVVKILKSNLFHVEAVLLHIALKNIDDENLSDLILNVPRWERDNG
jgi:hypothetical protein